MGILLLFTLAGCGGQADSSTGYEVTGAAEGAPEDCRPEQVAARLDQLGQAISTQDIGRVLTFFDESPFQWYSIDEAPTSTAQGFTAYNLADLEAYFLERFAQDEKWELVELYVNGWDSARKLVHFGPVHIRRTANDLPLELEGSENLTDGKGAYHCESQTFIVLSLVMEGE
ncbi:MAG: hypothetical protein JXB38_17010 [Anaerolineales bacterium]|nr:hypothetical protein [Anaerolineales bacterium]